VNKYYRDEKFKLDEELEALATEDLVIFHNKLSDLKARLREIKTLAPRA
jgi:glycyl-tRNA synthetase beta subunit